jgi:hypothetical protein
MDKYDCFILDEVSMVSDKDLNYILDYICEHDKKIIIIGDNCQIPSPSQNLIKDKFSCHKPDSSAFTICNLYELKEIVRQSADSYIIKIASFLRDNLLEELDLKDILRGADIKEEDICISYSDMYTYFKKDWENGLNCRIIAYTNAAVSSHNASVRKVLNYNDFLVINELLTGYSNVGFPMMIIENGTDYKVINIKKTHCHKINKFNDLAGYLVDIQDIDDNSNLSRNVFFIDIENSSNYYFMQDLVDRAEKVNRKYSKRNDYKNYCALKNYAVFINDVYKYDGKILNATTLKQIHPLLFTKIKELINTENKSIIQSELTKKIYDQYGDIIDARLSDNKSFADGEVFADMYKVVERDIYYGYAITTHKTQGSTYDVAFVDDNDFLKISNKWNFSLKTVEQRYKERNQLKYVAYTRASQKLFIVN